MNAALEFDPDNSDARWGFDDKPVDVPLAALTILGNMGSLNTEAASAIVSDISTRIVVKMHMTGIGLGYTELPLQLHKAVNMTSTSPKA
jgi:hypothetical protein